MPDVSSHRLHKRQKLNDLHFCEEESCSGVKTYHLPISRYMKLYNFLLLLLWLKSNIAKNFKLSYFHVSCSYFASRAEELINTVRPSLNIPPQKMLELNGVQNIPHLEFAAVLDYHSGWFQKDGRALPMFNQFSIRTQITLQIGPTVTFTFWRKNFAIFNQFPITAQIPTVPQPQWKKHLNLQVFLSNSSLFVCENYSQSNHNY